MASSRSAPGSHSMSPRVAISTRAAPFVLTELRTANWRIRPGHCGSILRPSGGSLAIFPAGRICAATALRAITSWRRPARETSTFRLSKNFHFHERYSFSSARSSSMPSTRPTLAIRTASALRQQTRWSPMELAWVSPQLAESDAGYSVWVEVFFLDLQTRFELTGRPSSRPVFCWVGIAKAKVGCNLRHLSGSNPASVFRHVFSNLQVKHSRRGTEGRPEVSVVPVCMKVKSRLNRLTAALFSLSIFVSVGHGFARRFPMPVGNFCARTLMFFRELRNSSSRTPNSFGG